MALLGTFWQVIGPVTVAPATGGALVGAAYSNYQHSLPTTPEVVIPVARSIQAHSQNSPVNLMQVGGTPTYATVGVLVGSCVSHPVVAMDIYAAMIHSSVR